MCEVLRALPPAQQFRLGVASTLVAIYSATGHMDKAKEVRWTVILLILYILYPVSELLLALLAINPGLCVRNLFGPDCM